MESTPLDWEKTEFQNQVQIIDKDYFAAALYFSYNFVTKDEGIDEIEYKYLNELKNKDLKLISNFIFEKNDLVVFLAKREELKAVESIFSVGSI